MFKIFKEEVELGGKKLILETGKNRKNSPTSRWRCNCYVR